MSMTVRVFISGLVAFVPNDDGSEVTAVLVESPSGHHRHEPMLFAAAGTCTGDCGGDLASIEELFTGGRSTPETEEWISIFEEITENGTAWRLSGADLNLGVGSDSGSLELHSSLGASEAVMPSNSDERADFSWVVQIGDVVPGAAQARPDLLGPEPPRQLVAARMKFDCGSLRVNQVAGVDELVAPVDFKTHSGADAVHRRAVADWVVVEMEVEGSEVVLSETNMDDPSKNRSVTLGPASVSGSERIDLMLLNVRASAIPGGNMQAGTAEADEPGEHFRMYYPLAASPPSRLPIPYPSAERGEAWPAVNPAGERDSRLFALLDEELRGVLDRVICPVAGLQAP